MKEKATADETALRTAQRWLASAILRTERLDEAAFAGEAAELFVTPPAGDVAAMLSLFRQRDFLRQLVMLPVKTRSFFNLVTELAPQVGEGLYGQADRAALRSARNALTYRQVEGDRDPHVRGQVLSGFALQVLEGIVRARLDSEIGRERGQGPHDLFRELMTAARHTMRMLLRPIDLLPPG